MPVITSRLVYIHLPKSAGTFVSHVLRRVAGGREVNGHAMAYSIKPNVRHEGWYCEHCGEQNKRTIFGTLRDPLPWYESVYFHAVRRGEEDAPFRDWLRLWTDSPNVNTREDCPLRPFARLAPLSIDVTRPFGIWSLAVRAWFGRLENRAVVLDGGWEVDKLVDCARLYEGLEQLIGIELTSELFPPENTRNEGQRVEWDDEMRGWVREADGWLADRLFTGEEVISPPL